MIICHSSRRKRRFLALTPRWLPSTLAGCPTLACGFPCLEPSHPHALPKIHFLPSLLPSCRAPVTTSTQMTHTSILQAPIWVEFQVCEHTCLPGSSSQTKSVTSKQIGPKNEIITFPQPQTLLVAWSSGAPGPPKGSCLLLVEFSFLQSEHCNPQLCSPAAGGCFPLPAATRIPDHTAISSQKLPMGQCSFSYFESLPLLLLAVTWRKLSTYKGSCD